MNDLDLECVTSFLVVVEEKHFARAAARLHVTPTAVSRRVQKLERQLGVCLVERDHLGTSRPTPAGQRFAVAAPGLLRHAQQARREARGQTSAVKTSTVLPSGSTAPTP